MGTDWHRMRLRPSAGDVDLPGQKVRLSRIPEFGEYLADALASSWHTGCLTWIHWAAEQGYGLLLDW